MLLKNLSPHGRGILLTAFGGFVLSFDIPILRLADGDVWPILFTRSICTMVIALVVWVAVRAITGKRLVFLPGRAGVAIAALYGLSTICFLLAVFNTSSANVAFILAFNPMFAALLSWLFLREKPSTATLLAMAAMTVGVIIIVGSGLESGHLFGDLMAAASALCIAAALTWSRADGRDFSYTPLIATIFPAAVGLALSLESGFTIEAPGWAIFNGLLLIPFAFWALATGPRFISAAETAMFYLLETVLAPVWVWLVFSEKPPYATLVGGAIILVSLVAHSAYGLMRPSRSSENIGHH